MHLVPCHTPSGPLEAAPITSLVAHMDQSAGELDAFWTAEDDYVVRSADAEGVTWYRVAAEGSSATPELAEPERRRLGELMASIIPLGGHRVAFPVGSSGRRVYRVWSGRRGAGAGEGRGPRRIRILGGRAGRSRRQPA